MKPGVVRVPANQIEQTGSRFGTDLSREHPTGNLLGFLLSFLGGRAGGLRSGAIHRAGLQGGRLLKNGFAHQVAIRCGEPSFTVGGLSTGILSFHYKM